MGNYSFAAKMLSNGNKWAAGVMGSIKSSRKAKNSRSNGKLGGRKPSRGK